MWDALCLNAYASNVHKYLDYSLLVSSIRCRTDAEVDWQIQHTVVCDCGWNSMPMAFDVALSLFHLAIRWEQNRIDSLNEQVDNKY